MNGKKLERPLHLDMSADEALSRFLQTKPEEVEPPPGQARKRARPSVTRDPLLDLENDERRAPKIEP